MVYVFLLLLFLSRLLGAILWSAGHSGRNTLKIHSASDQMVAHTWKIWHSSTTHKNDRMLLQVVTFSRNIGNDDFAVGQLDTGDLTYSWIRFLGFSSVHFVANALLLVALVESWRLWLLWCLLAHFPNHLVECCHSSSLFLLDGVVCEVWEDGWGAFGERW